jgi:hypothetical protein
MVEFAYHINWHSSININPSYVLYGQECLIIHSISTSTFKMKGINQMMATMQQTLRLV